MSDFRLMDNDVSALLFDDDLNFIEQIKWVEFSGSIPSSARKVVLLKVIDDVKYKIKIKEAFFYLMTRSFFKLRNLQVLDFVFVGHDFFSTSLVSEHSSFIEDISLNKQRMMVHI